MQKSRRQLLYVGQNIILLWFYIFSHTFKTNTLKPITLCRTKHYFTFALYFQSYIQNEYFGSLYTNFKRTIASLNTKTFITAKVYTKQTDRQTLI